MPSNRKLRLAPEAEDDLVALLQYTADTWGRRQASTYKATLYRAMRRLTVYPYLGRARDELAPGLRGFPVEQHIVLYRVEDREIAVARIMHGRQDIAQEFGESS